MRWRSVELGGDAIASAERPDVGHGAIAVAYAGGRIAAGAHPVLGVLDVDGSPGFTLTHELGGPSYATSEPCIDGHGIVRAIVDDATTLTVVAAYTDGARRPSTQLPSTARGTNPALQLAPCADGFVASWATWEDAFVGRFDDGRAAPVWSADEWLLAWTHDALLCADVDGWIARDAATGEPLWQRAIGPRAHAVPSPAGFLLVEAGRVQLVDPCTGATRLALAIEGELRSVHATADLVSALCDGELVTSRGARTPIAASWPPTREPVPVIVDHLGDDVLWADTTVLHLGTRTFGLPARLGGVWPRGRGLAKANAVVAHGHVYLRAGTQLWIGELPRYW